MVYSTYMKQKKIVQYLICVLILSLSFIKVHASTPSFSFYPTSGIVKDAKEGFTLDVLIDSGSYELSKARARISFNPKNIQLRRALRNNSLFEQWPEDQSSTDNTNGVVILTGITEEENEEEIPFYKTDASPDVFFRLEFDVITTKNEDIILSFEYTGEDKEYMSVLIDSDTSENVLALKPKSVSFSLNEEDIPKTGISLSAIGSIVGILLILAGGYIRTTSKTFFSKKTGTIVLSD